MSLKLKEATGPAAMPAPSPKMTDRAYVQRMYADLRRPLDEEAAEIEAVLLKRRDKAAAAAIMRMIRPFLKSGKRARAARRRPQVLPAATAA